MDNKTVLGNARRGGLFNGDRIITSHFCTLLLFTKIKTDLLMGSNGLCPIF